MTYKENPWATISPDDYEGHMSSPNVKQLTFLADCLKQGLTKYAPEEVAIIGCGTGNGLEYIDPACTKHTTVVDINASFLEVLKRRYEHRIPGLEIVHDDLNHCALQPNQYSLIFAGLVFEYLESYTLLQKISEWLREDAIFQVVLQRPSHNLPEISETKYVSLKTLKSIVKLVDIEQFCRECQQCNLLEVERRMVTLDSGKSFYVGMFKKTLA